METFTPRASRPDRRLVQRVAERMARRYKVSLTDMYGMNLRVAVKLANRQAWRVILRATGCTVGGLAHVWGCHRQSIHNSLRRTIEPDLKAVAVARAQARATLRWLYGDFIADEKMASREWQTRQDIARWNALGRKDAA